MVYKNLTTNKVKFSTRLASYLIDLLVIYGLTYLIVTIATFIPVYVSAYYLFVILAFLYNLIFFIISGNTPGKIIAGIKIITFRNSDLRMINVFIREIIGKLVIGFLPPLIMSRLLFPHFWFFDLSLVILYQFVLFIIYLIKKSTWFDIIAKTKIVNNEEYNKPLILKSLVLVFVVTLFVIIVRLFNFGNMNNFIPRHSQIALSPYIKFIEKNNTTPKDYILNLFDKYDIVVLCERSHPEMTQWDLIYQVISDSVFIRKVGNIFTEYGTVNLQDYLNQLMENPNLSENEVDERIIYMMRNLMEWGSWPNTNFYLYLKKLYELNKHLPDSEKIHHYFSDVPIDWNNMTSEKYDIFRIRYLANRDYEMAVNVINEFNKIRMSDSRRKKALVIMNYRHAFRFNLGGADPNTAAFIFEEYPSITANILLNTVKMDWNFISRLPVQDGIWDDAFEKCGNKNIGFDLDNSPFGEDNFDLYPKKFWNDLKYKDVFTGFIFYKPLKEHYFQTGIPNLYDNFLDEQIRRDKIIDKSNTISIEEAKGIYKNDIIKKGYEDYKDVSTKINLSVFLFLLVLTIPVFVYMSCKNYLMMKILR